MKLIKLTDDHYVVVDDSEIKEGDWYYDTNDKESLMPIYQRSQDPKFYSGCKKITHSTHKLYINDFWAIIELKLSEVKELIGEVDVEKKAEEYFNAYDNTEHTEGLITGFEHGYNQALEDNKEKKYTEEDMLNAFREGTNAGALHERLSDYDNGDYNDAEEYSEQYEESFIQSLQPKTEWEVEIIDSKLKLKC